MDYKKVLRLHFVNHLSAAVKSPKAAATAAKQPCQRVSRNASERIQELSYPLPADVTNEYIGHAL